MKNWSKARKIHLETADMNGVMEVQAVEVSSIIQLLHTKVVMFQREPPHQVSGSKVQIAFWQILINLKTVEISI